MLPPAPRPRIANTEATCSLQHSYGPATPEAHGSPIVAPAEATSTAPAGLHQPHITHHNMPHFAMAAAAPQATSRPRRRVFATHIRQTGPKTSLRCLCEFCLFRFLHTAPCCCSLHAVVDEVDIRGPGIVLESATRGHVGADSLIIFPPTGNASAQLLHIYIYIYYYIFLGQFQKPETGAWKARVDTASAR